MIPLFSHDNRHEDLPEHAAHVDADGHITIGGHVPAQRNSDWEITESDPVIREAGTGIRSRLKQTAIGVLSESKTQYVHSIKGLRFEVNDMRGSLRRIWSALHSTLTQPVWVMRTNKKPKQYNRGTLFVLDVVRFGGTFAGIFVVLFVSMNFRSFAQIITPYLNPVERVASVQGTVSEVDNALKQKLLKSPMLAVAGREEGNLLSYLPTVGPPENRVIIPKIGVNIPLVTPSYSSLLKEDWAGVEEDIQEALQQGVVHYPGTARPGQAGNFFVTGHSSYYPWAKGVAKTIFARLHELSVGDEYWVYYGGDKHRYVITGKKEVKPSDVTVLDQPTNKRIGTLMTCTPVGTTLRRLIVSSQEVDPVTGIALKVGEHETRTIDQTLPAALPI